MNLFKKIKNWFDEEDEPVMDNATVKKDLELTASFEPIKIKEPKKIFKLPEEDSIKEPEDIISERELFRADKTFGFPIDMEEEKFEERKQVNILEYEKKVGLEQKKEENIEKRKFKASPIISPVYGILDKNYVKEDIVEKEPVIRTNKESVNFDTIRAKAFGDLSDDIERTFAEDTALFFNLKEEINEAEEKLLFTNTQELSNPIGDVSIGDAHEIYDDYGLEYNKDKVIVETKSDESQEIEVNIKIKEKKEKPEIVISKEDSEVEAQSIIKTNKNSKEEINLDETDSDLFNLIDSMYEESEV